MLTKRQLEDAAECLTRFHERTCGQCSCNKFRYGYVGSYGCTENAAQTALAYREMLERARKTLQDAWDDDGSITVGKQILETINAIDALLGGEKDA